SPRRFARDVRRERNPSRGQCPPSQRRDEPPADSRRCERDPRGALVNRRVGLPRTELALTVACALCGVAPVFALLAWVYGLGPFAVWVWGLGATAGVFLALVGFWLSRSGRESRLRTALYCGVVGGLIGV